MAHILGSWAAYSNMCAYAYVQEAHLLAKEAQSPLQNTILVKWKTPNWVPAEARPLMKQSDPSTLVGIKTPQTTDPPEEWARWLWRYPREVAMHPGILRAHYGINISSVRGMLMVTARALHKVITHRTWSAFLICMAQLISTLGLYQLLVDNLHLTIAITPCVTPAQMSDNTTVEDMVRLFAGDGITIPQISNAFKWGQTALAGWSTGRAPRGANNNTRWNTVRHNCQ